MGRWARRWNRSVMSVLVMATSAGMSMRSARRRLAGQVKPSPHESPVTVSRHCRLGCLIGPRAIFVRLDYSPAWDGSPCAA